MNFYNPGLWKQKRRWLQLCLWTLFVLAVVLGVVLWSVSGRLRKAAKQRNTIAQIQEMQGTVLYDYEYGFTVANSRIPDWERPQASPIFLRLILGEDFFANVVYVQLASNQITDESLHQIDGLKNLGHLQHLNLLGSQISDRSIPLLAELAQLRILELVDTQVTEDGVAKLQEELPNCRILWSDRR